mmetsp:Transcript_70582/g.117194  ORF Transcript_70582/g.117194 Transcript_70582/m.117194 type:complete len:203 (-) Transcript_70582:1130-1738(-)
MKSSASWNDMASRSGRGTFTRPDSKRTMRRCFRLATERSRHAVSTPPCHELQCRASGSTEPEASEVVARRALASWVPGGGSQGDAAGGASGRCIGQSSRGDSSISSSKLPAHSSRFVRKEDRLNRFLTVAATEVSSNCEVFIGPFGSWMTKFFCTHGETSIAVARSPKRLKSKASPQFGCTPGTTQLDSSAGTPSYGGTTWS